MLPNKRLTSILLNSFFLVQQQLFGTNATDEASDRESIRIDDPGRGSSIGYLMTGESLSENIAVGCLINAAGKQARSLRWG